MVVLVKQKTEQVAVIQASLDVATVELTDLQKVAVAEVVAEPVLVAEVATITKG